VAACGMGGLLWTQFAVPLHHHDRCGPHITTAPRWCRDGAQLRNYDGPYGSATESIIKQITRILSYFYSAGPWAAVLVQESGVHLIYNSPWTFLCDFSASPATVKAGNLTGRAVLAGCGSESITVSLLNL